MRHRTAHACLGRASYRRRGLVVIVWLVVLAALGARLVTAAALIMTAVFAGFILVEDPRPARGFATW